MKIPEQTPFGIGVVLHEISQDPEIAVRVALGMHRLGDAMMQDELRMRWRHPWRGAVHIETHWKPNGGENGTPATHTGLARILNEIALEEEQP